METAKYLIRLILFSFLITGLFALNAFCEDDPPSVFDDAEAEIDAEFEWLREEAVVMTEIATRTEMDADLVPGMVTILKGEDLTARGVRTVFEALTLVPGINTLVNAMGERRVSVRGIGGGFFSGNLKVLLNDIVLNDTLAAMGPVLYEIPIELIDRIEIIRGPGSVVYGEFAYAGVINVKTRQKGVRMFGRVEGDDDSLYSHGGGGTMAYENPEHEFSLSLNLSGWESDGPDIETGEDRLYGMGLGYYSMAPGKSNQSAEDKLADATLKYKGFSLTGQYLYSAKGDYFGVINALPPPFEDVKLSDKHVGFEARQNLDFIDSIEFDLKAGLRRYEFHLDNLIALPPILGVPIPTPDGLITIDITPQDGSIAGPFYEERELYAGAESIWTGLDRNTFLFGLKYSKITMEDVWATANTVESNYGVLMRAEGDDNWMVEDRERDVFSLYVQDLFELTDFLTLTAGFRYDHYDNNDDTVGTYDNLTPRLSAVYRLTDRHILKAQYSEAVRPPTFTELYSRGNSVVAGNMELDPEQIKSYEFGYIFRKTGTTGRATLFYSMLEDNIEYPQYANTIGENAEGIRYFNASDTITAQGFELELSHDIIETLRLTATLSFADTEDVEGEPLTGSTDWIGTAGLLYRPLKDYSLALKHRYVGEIYRAPDDNREDLDATNTVDISGNVFNLFKKGVTFRVGVRNIFDEDITDPAPVIKDDAGEIAYMYREDYPRAGREWWAQLSYDF